MSRNEWRVFISVIAMAMAASLCAQDRAVYPGSTRLSAGPAAESFPSGCPASHAWLAGYDLTVGTRSITPSTVYSVAFPEPIGSNLGLGYVHGLLAVDAGQSGAPARPRVSWRGPAGPFAIASSSAVQPALDTQGNQRIAIWCDGGVYSLWKFSIALFGAGNSTQTLWVSSSNGPLSFVAIWGPAL